jgi:hypothetical protein
MTDAEDLFPPVPGGMVDTARRKAAADAAQLQELGPPADPRVKVDVPVMDKGAELGRARTYSLSTSSVVNPVELLGRDEDRRYAAIMTLDEPVVISFSEQAAQDSRNAVNAAGLSANGFVLPVGVLIPVSYTGVIWCTATSGTATRISVMSFSYRAP